MAGEKSVSSPLALLHKDLTFVPPHFCPCAKASWRAECEYCQPQDFGVVCRVMNCFLQSDDPHFLHRILTIADLPVLCKESLILLFDGKGDNLIWLSCPNLTPQPALESMKIVPFPPPLSNQALKAGKFPLCASALVKWTRI